MSNTPLANADPNSLAELFSRDPLDLEEPDLTRMVAAFRAQREKFRVEDTAAKRESRRKKPTAYKLDESIDNETLLDDLLGAL